MPPSPPAARPYGQLVVIGRRRAAIDAALAAADEVAVIAPKLGTPLASDPRVRWLRADPEREAPEDLADALGVERPVAVLAAAEGTVPCAASLRRVLGLPGLSPGVAARCTDKARMKAAIRSAEIPCADWITADEGLDRDALIARLGLPLVVKDRVGSGGRGTRIVRSADEVPETLAPGRMAEAFVTGREASVEAIVHRGEIVWSNLTEYYEPRAINVLPSPPAGGVDALALVARAIAAIGVERGFTHTEIYFGADGVVFGELAARPPGGYIMPAIAVAYGFDAWRAWLDVECGRRPCTVSRAARVAAAQVIHPGAGEVLEASGVEAARRLPGVHEAALRVRAGSRLPPRLGAGQEAGHLLVEGADRGEALERLAAAAGTIRLRVRR